MTTITPIKQLFLALCVLGLAACASQEPEVQTGPDAEVIMGNLHRVDNSRAQLAWKDPNADFSRFNSILLDPLNLDRVEIIQPSRSVTQRRAWELTEEDEDNLRRHFREVFTRDLEETGDYKIVDAPGDNVLRISAAITAIAPNAPRDDFRSRQVGRSRVYTEGAGSMSIAFAFSDSESGEMMAIVKDARSGNPNWGNNNRVSNMADVRFMFGSWARMIRSRLDVMHGY